MTLRKIEIVETGELAYAGLVKYNGQTELRVARMSYHPEFLELCERYNGPSKCSEFVEDERAIAWCRGEWSGLYPEREPLKNRIISKIKDVLDRDDDQADGPDDKLFTED